MKWIFKYLKGKTNFGLWYLKGNELTMVSFMDTYWEGSIYDKIASGESFYLGEFLVS
jgi:hypothetical protein